MGLLGELLGRGDKGGPEPDMSSGYAPMTQAIDPTLMPLLNAPQMANAQIAQAATDNSDVIKRFREGLTGKREVKEFNVKTGRAEVKTVVFAEPAMNETGISEMCRELEMYLNKTFILSNVPNADKRRLDAMGRIIWKTLNQKLIVNAIRYDLDKTRRPNIVHEMVFNILFNAMRSFEDGERPKYYGSQRTVQTISTQNTGGPGVPQKRNMFGFPV